MNRTLFEAGTRAAVALFALFALSAVAGARQLHQGFEEPARLVVKSEVLGEERTALVRVPPGYAAGRERYPVLYMTDGDAHILHTTATVSFLAERGHLPEMIVVAITNTNRTRDLSPTRTEAAPAGGGADKFLKFIETELIPQVEAKYRTHPYRIFAGHSLGGLFAVHALLTRPELFNAYIAVSPSMHWGDFAEVKRAEEFFRDRKELWRTLYVTLGHEGDLITRGYERLRDVLSKQKVKGFEWEAAQMADEDHGSVVLRSHYAGLRKVFAGWRVPFDPNTGAVAGGLKGVDEHYAKLSKRLGYTVATPEGLINQMGYGLMFQKKMDEAIAVFKANIERYPESANVYDSLAEAYEKSGQIELALANYEKAAALGKRNGDANTAIYQANFERASELAKKAQAKPNGSSGNK